MAEDLVPVGVGKGVHVQVRMRLAHSGVSKQMDVYSTEIRNTVCLTLEVS